MTQITSEMTKKWGIWIAVLASISAAILLVIVVRPASGAETVEQFGAESMTLSPNSAGEVYKNRKAIDNRYLYVWSDSTSSKTVTLPKGAYRVLVRAKGASCDGEPNMVVRVDGQETIARSVRGDRWSDYNGEIDISSDGEHTVDITYDNDYMTSKCDRNLRLDHVRFQAVSSVPEPGTAPESGQQVILRDDFDGTSLDSSLWTAPDHPLGHGGVRGRNVSVSNGKLYLKMPANSLEGAEIKSAKKYQYGSYTTRMKAPPTSDTYTAPFMWTDPDFDSEIDIEVYGDGSRTTWLNTYSSTNPRYPNDTFQNKAVKLPFDPSAGFHDYRWDYSPDSVKFYVDGIYYGAINEYIPPSEMYLFVNAYWPKQFQSPQKLSSDLYAEVEYIEVRSLPGT